MCELLHIVGDLFAGRLRRNSAVDLVCPEARWPDSVLCAARRLFHLGIGIPQRIDGSGNLWHQFARRSFVRVGSVGILKNRAERQFLVPGGQADNSDRRRVPLLVSEHKP